MTIRSIPMWVHLILYATGLAAVGYIVYSITGDPLVSGAFVFFARWVKPFSRSV